MKIYITDCDHESMEIEKQTFTQNGVDFAILNITQPDDIIKHCHDADALVLQYATISDDVLSNLKNLKGVVRYGVVSIPLILNLQQKIMSQFAMCLIMVPMKWQIMPYHSSWR